MNDVLIQYILKGPTTQAAINARIIRITNIMVSLGYSQIAAQKIISQALNQSLEEQTYIIEAQTNTTTLEAIKIAQEILKGK